MPGEVYYIEINSLPWILPLIEITGILLQAVAFFLKSKIILLLGWLMIVICAFMQSDLVLIVGDTLIACGLWLCLDIK